MADRDYRSAGFPPRPAPSRTPEQAIEAARRYAGAPSTPHSAAALAHWHRYVSVPSLASPFLMFTQCLAYAAPVWARLHHRPIAWCFHGPEISGRSVLPLLAACLYGDRGLPTWRALGSRLPDNLAAREEGLLAITESAPSDLLAQITVAARMWHDHKADPALADRRDAISIFDSDERFRAHLARARYGEGKLWVLSVLADAGTGHGIYTDQPPDGSAAGAAAILLIRAQKAPAEAGVRWLRFVNWWPDEQLAALFRDDSAAELDHAPLDIRTGLSCADVGMCFNFASIAGKWATEQGLTGWPRGAAFEASQQVLAAWGSSALGQS